MYKRKKGSYLPYALIAPSILIIVLFLVVPLIFSLYVSLWRSDFMNFSKFLGFGNYLKLLGDSDILFSILRTFCISFISLVISLILGVSLALWLNSLSAGIAFVIEILILIPWVTSMVVSTLQWKWLFQDDLGLINYILSLFGLQRQGFLSDKNLAMYTLIFVMTWRIVAYVMVQILAGLKGIPKEYDEAAKIDGANKFQIFSKIRLPLLKTPIAISAIIIGLSNLNNVTVPLTLTGGGPGRSTMVIAIEAYEQSFSYGHFGESSALSILLCVINFILIVLYIKAVKYEI